VFRLTPALRPDAERLLRDLSEAYEVALLSGDNAKERPRFRRLLGDGARLEFNQSPIEKLEFIRGRQQARQTVMMVGDGLNDAGALRQSDVGVAVVERVGVFSPASDVIIEAARVPQLGALLHLARRVVRVVYVSFGISAMYNLVGLSIAVAGVLSPAICAILMPLSSVSVVVFACAAAGRAAGRAGIAPERIPG
jgi:Cu+-exporting ATPase